MVEGFGMEPNLHDKQFLMTRRYYLDHPLERGDVVVFRYPLDRTRDFIKRVVGLSGEKVEIRLGQVYINDTVLLEPYSILPAAYSWGPDTVGSDQYFVLGDNRINSSDSHSWGMLSASDVLGKAWFSYWPLQYWGLVR